MTHIIDVISILGAIFSALSAMYAADAAYKARMMFIHSHRISFYENFRFFNHHLMDATSEIIPREILDFKKELEKADFYFSEETRKTLKEYEIKLGVLNSKICHVNRNDEEILRLREEITSKIYNDTKESLKQEIQKTIEVGWIAFLKRKYGELKHFIFSHGFLQNNR